MVCVMMFECTTNPTPKKRSVRCLPPILACRSRASADHQRLLETSNTGDALRAINFSQGKVSTRTKERFLELPVSAGSATWRRQYEPETKGMPVILGAKLCGWRGVRTPANIECVSAKRRGGEVRQKRRWR